VGRREDEALPTGVQVPEGPGAATEAVEQLLEEVADETLPLLDPAGDGLRGAGVVITGGATGIGRAAAIEFARRGASVAVNDLDADDGMREAAQATAAELRQLEVDVYCRACDVRDGDDAAAFVREALEAFGTLSVLVNNAGIGRDRALWRMSDEQWSDVLETNLTGAFNMIRAVAPRFRHQQHGKIVNVSSVHAIRAEFGIANYAASKAGMIGLTRAAAVELGPSNVNVNAVAPGYIRTTRLTEGVPAEIMDRARERSALGRLGDPQDVASIIVFLSSEAARHITGVVVPVDGGYLL
jgi:NAD(P)-dependent dehydrogenase (short-subunit alcohol dehydrogenase family)